MAVHQPVGGRNQVRHYWIDHRLSGGQREDAVFFLVADLDGFQIQIGRPAINGNPRRPGERRACRFEGLRRIRNQHYWYAIDDWIHVTRRAPQRARGVAQRPMVARTDETLA